MIIVDQEIITGKEEAFKLLKEFESSDDVIVLKTNHSLPLYGPNDSVSVSVHHLIDFRCEMLDSEMKMTLVILVFY